MLSHSTMEVINGIKQQIISQLQKTEMLKDFKSSNENSHNWNVIRTALAMGGYPNIARLDKAANQLRTMWVYKTNNIKCKQIKLWKIMFIFFRKESKVRFHPSCDIMKGGRARGKEKDTKKSLKNQNSEWYGPRIFF